MMKQEILKRRPRWWLAMSSEQRSQLTRRHRSNMRQHALEMRRHLCPRAFDGTKATYNANVKRAVQQLRLAVVFRRWSHEYA